MKACPEEMSIRKPTAIRCDSDVQMATPIRSQRTCFLDFSFFVISHYVRGKNGSPSNLKLHLKKQMAFNVLLQNVCAESVLYAKQCAKDAIQPKA